MNKIKGFSILAVLAFWSLFAARQWSSMGMSPLDRAQVAIESSRLQVFSYRVIHSYPHDPAAFTQGLAFDENGALYESTGLKGQSTLRTVDLETGQVLGSRNLPDDVFGEGITILDGNIYQLTWKEQVGFVYERDFNLLRDFTYPMEGWGLTHEEGTDKNRLIMSDGSSTLYFLDPQTFEVVDSRQVRTDNNDSLPMLNELEWIDGKIYANIWKTNYIAKIDPATGQVVGWIDLTGLLSPEEYKRADVLNGIAYDKNGRWFVGGKLWPRLFEIEVISFVLIPQGQISSELEVGVHRSGTSVR